MLYIDHFYYALHFLQIWKLAPERLHGCSVLAAWWWSWILEPGFLFSKFCPFFPPPPLPKLLPSLWLSRFLWRILNTFLQGCLPLPSLSSIALSEPLGFPFSPLVSPATETHLSWSMFMYYNLNTPPLLPLSLRPCPLISFLQTLDALVQSAAPPSANTQWMVIHFLWVLFSERKWKY